MKLSKLLKSNGVGRESNFLRILEKIEENPIETTRESIRLYEVIIDKLNREQHKIANMSEMKRREYFLENPNVRCISKKIKDWEKLLRLEKDYLKMQLRSERVKKKKSGGMDKN